MTRFVVGPDEAGQRLDVVLAERIAMSRSRAAGLLDSGRVHVGGSPVPKGHRCRAGDDVEVLAPVEDAQTEVPPPPMPPVRHRDEHLLVVAKPPGLVVHPGAGRPGGTLVDALRAAGVPLAPVGDAERPGIVHRLDRDTSGLLVVASSEAAHRGLTGALRRREVARRYLALVRGRPRAERGRIEAPIGRHPDQRTRFGVVVGGRPSVTRYRILDTATVTVDGRAEVVSLLACALETGRTHQIRVHLTELGHPLVGDAVYGPRPALAAALALPRVFLHAAALAFRHPVTGAPVAVEEPLPDDLTAALARAGLEVPAGGFEVTTGWD